MKQFRVYADTSVFGGCFDEEFSKESILFFEQVKRGEFILVISQTTERELIKAPEKVREVLANIPESQLEIIPASDEIDILRDAYLKAGIVGPSSAADAEHIAAASIGNVDFVISWNFKDIVHYDKISGYQSVNVFNGYGLIRIYSPKEVVNYEP